MVFFGDDLERIINQQVQAKWDCRRCGTSFTFQGGITCARERGIADKVVMCAKCNSVYGVDVTIGGGFALLDEVTHRYPKVTTERTTFTGHTGQVNACAVSPDGTWIVSADWDTLKIWDAATGTERTTLSLPRRATAVALHPSIPMVIYGDAGGGMHAAHLAGISLGPFVVTAIERSQELTLRCPACREVFQVERERLGTDATCPVPACGARLQINPFVPQPLPRRRPLGLRWSRRR